MIGPEIDQVENCTVWTSPSSVHAVPYGITAIALTPPPFFSVINCVVLLELMSFCIYRVSSKSPVYFAEIKACRLNNAMI